MPAGAAKLVHVPHPRTKRGWLAVAGLAVLALAGVVTALYFVLFGGSSVAPLALSSHPNRSTSATAAATDTQLAGSWTIASGSVAGYRVREQLAVLPAPSDAVGRTSNVSGNVTLDGAPEALTVTAADLTVDVSTLTSDRQMRDQRIHVDGLQSNTYPKATFQLTAPIALPANATSGAAISASATGKLTIHGTTQTVTIPLTAQFGSNQIEIVGSTTFPFERFGMTPPNIAGVVSVQDSATMEFDIHLRHT